MKCVGKVREFYEKKATQTKSLVKDLRTFDSLLRHCRNAQDSSNESTIQRTQISTLVLTVQGNEAYDIRTAEIA